MITICLRDLNTSPCEMIVEVKRDVKSDWDIMSDRQRINAKYDAFEEFTKLARAAIPIQTAGKNVDVFISLYENQATFPIPQEFFQLIADAGWSVKFDIN